jgi:hypothetical protein
MSHILIGTHVKWTMFVLKITLQLTTLNIPFKFTQIQLPLTLAMTINNIKIYKSVKYVSLNL